MVDTDGEIIDALRSENKALKKKVAVVAVLGLALGSGGVFGVFKWLASDKKVADAQVRESTLTTEIMKFKALSEIYKSRIAEIESKIENIDPTSTEALDLTNAINLIQIELENLELDSTDIIENISKTITVTDPVDNN